MTGVLPERVAIIPDGNRRYAKGRGLPLERAYADGFRKVGDVSKWAKEEGVKGVTFWALSLENFRMRSSGELSVLFGLMRSHLAEAARESENSQGTRIRFFGRTDLLPLALRKGIGELERRTAGNSAFELSVAVAYSGQDEFLRATKLLARDLASGRVSEKQLSEMGEAEMSRYLYVPYSPNLIIRTGNVQRLSGFLPFQSAYSEFFFSPKLWPEFSRADFREAIAYYGTVERRFGK